MAIDKATPMDTDEETLPTGNTTLKDKTMTDASSAPLAVYSTEEEEARQAIEMMKGDDLANRIAAAGRLDFVAKALGEKRTREELLPFLTDGIDDEDDVLTAVASSLGKMTPYVGGPSHVHNLLVPLETLLAVEESSVRECAQKSTLTVAEMLPTEHFQSHYSSLLTRLANKEWFTARTSACTLIAEAFSKLTSEQQELHLAHFSQLCRDEVPMVRRVAAQYLGKMLISVVDVKGSRAIGPDGMLTTTMLPLYEELAGHDQPDSVRLHTAENCIAFGEGVTKVQESGESDELSTAAADVLVKRILPLIVATIDDRSWRVRWTAASKFAPVVQSFSKLDGALDSLIPAFEKLLQDPEAEVRTAATLNLAEVAKCDGSVISPAVNQNDENNTPRISVAKRLVKKITILTEDESENVRAALAMVATELAPTLGKTATIADLVPPVLLLLRDSTSEVRLNVISSLGALNEVIGVDLLSQSLLPAILDLAQDGKWRIRLAIMQHIPLLAKQLGKVFFTERLVALCIGWLGDDISSIRQAATENLKELTGIFGSEWAAEFLLTGLGDVRRHRSYLRRLAAVNAFTLMGTVMEPAYTRTEILPLILLMATDNVANIRFNVAKGLERIAPICGSSTSDSQIRPILNLLAEDADRDVRYYADKTLKSLNMESSAGVK